MVEYRVDILLFCWPEAGEWNGTLLDHFENGTFDGFRGALDHIDAWATLAHSGAIPWSNGAAASDAIGVITARPDGERWEQFWPLAAYSPRLINQEHFGGGPSRSREDVEEALGAFEVDPRRYTPAVDSLWTAFDDTVSHIGAHSGLHRQRSDEQALAVATAMRST